MDRGRFDAELGGALAGVGLLPGLVDEKAGAGFAPAGAEVGVFEDGAHGDDALFLAVLGAEHDAGFDGLARRGERERTAGEGDAAAGFFGTAEKQFQQLAAAGADEPEKAEDLAGGGGERAGFGEAGAAQAFDDEAGAGGRARRVVVDVREFAADHALDDGVAGERGEVGRVHVAAVAQNRDAVAELENFLHAVGHVEDGAAAGAEFADDGEEPAHFAVREAAGGFVEGDDAGTAGEGFGDLDHLALAE